MADNTSVETFEESVQADAAQAPEENGNQIQGLSSFFEEAGREEDEQPSQDRPESEGKVSGGIKGRLLDSERKGYSRGQAEANAAWQAKEAQYQARIHELENYEIKEQARALAEKEKISIEFAERVIRAERGVPAQAQPQTQPETQPTNAQPRDAQGRFVARQQAPGDDVNSYAQTLLEQAKTIKRLTGEDMMALYNSDPTVQERIASREIDFYGLAEERRNGGGRRMPPVVRSSNGQPVHRHSIADLTDDQFDELDRRLEQGAVFDMRR